MFLFIAVRYKLASNEISIRSAVVTALRMIFLRVSPLAEEKQFFWRRIWIRFCF